MEGASVCTRTSSIASFLPTFWRTHSSESFAKEARSAGRREGSRRVVARCEFGICLGNGIAPFVVLPGNSQGISSQKSLRIPNLHPTHGIQKLPRKTSGKVCSRPLLRPSCSCGRLVHATPNNAGTTVPQPTTATLLSPVGGVAPSTRRPCGVDTGGCRAPIQHHRRQQEHNRTGSTEITHIMSPAIFIPSQLLQPCQEPPTTFGPPNWTLLWQICSLESFGCEEPKNQPHIASRRQSP